VRVTLRNRSVFKPTTPHHSGSTLTNGLHAHRLTEQRSCYDLPLDQWRGLDFGYGLDMPTTLPQDALTTKQASRGRWKQALFEALNG